MQQPLNSLIRQILDCPDAQLIANKATVDQLVEQLCSITGICLHPNLFLDEHATLTTQGKAVSMTTAAQCAEEYMRTQVFLRGVYQAIQAQLVVHDEIEILYAGTGPFGLLLVPLLPLFSPTQVKVTLLDIHSESLTALNRVIQAFGVQERITRIECVDILQWRPEAEQRYQLIISETMKAMLRQEPQISIFSHLSPWLARDGQLIPQQIQIDAWLEIANTEPRKVGNIFTLNKQTSLILNQQTPADINASLKIPAWQAERANLKFTTTIQVYADHWLHEKQCSLNLPEYIRDANPQPGSQLRCHYNFGGQPGFEFEFKPLPGAAGNPLPSLMDTDMLGAPHLNRLWYKAQHTKQGKLAAEIRKREWPLDLQLLDILNLDLETALQTLFHHPGPEAFVSLILENNQGEISPAQRSAIERCVSDYLRRARHTGDPH